MEEQDYAEDINNVEMQSRPGTHHVYGGRKRRPNAEDMIQLERDQMEFLLIKTLLNCCGGRIEDIYVLVGRIWDDVRTRMRRVNDTDVLPRSTKEGLYTYFKATTVRNPRTGYEILPGPFLGVCSKSPETVRIGVGHVMERHTACTWIDTMGGVLCTCVGNTNYSIAISTRTEDDDYMNGGIECNHVRSFEKVLRTISDVFGTRTRNIGLTVSRIVAHSSTTSFSQHAYSLPKVYLFHNSTVYVTIFGLTGQPNTTMFVPVRRVRRRKVIRYVCAFCDLHRRSLCMHTQFAIRI